MTSSTEFGTILIADDDSDIREMLSYILERHHMHVVGAADGTQALARARDTADLVLVLLDLRMPGLSGAEVIEEMRHDPALAKIPVVVLSGDRSARDTARSLGAAGCLAKPFEVSELMREVHRFVPETPDQPVSVG
ncbi:MAG: Two-component response regulator [Myxococcales bacterium]|nr:Two-component response regulator [Myxococcales bacterium]